MKEIKLSTLIHISGDCLATHFPLNHSGGVIVAQDHERHFHRVLLNLKLNF